MRDLTVNIQETTAVLKHPVETYEQAGEEEFILSVSMEAGQEVFVLGHFSNKDMASGKAYIVFDGVEAVTVCSSLLDLN